MKTFEYTFKFKPGIAEYLFKEMTFDERKKEREILKQLVDGKTCWEIGNDIGFSERTIQRRRKDLYEKTNSYM